MTKRRKKPSPVKAPPPPPPSLPPRSRRRYRWVAVTAGVLVAIGLGGYLVAWLTAPATPAVALTDADPAVADAVEAARRAVWWSPRSAVAWGRLGQVLGGL